MTTYHDANTLRMFLTNTGSFAHDQAGMFGRSDGLYFTKHLDRTVVYAAGLWIGAVVDGQPRVTVAEYSDEYVPGPMLGGTFQPDRPEYRVYKISAGDTPASNPDYADWPFDQGAPALKDHAGDDSLDANGERIPLLKGSQAL
ncbi:MAG: hypothetical protein GF341_06225, partial [candidate division Zixibacteria bacterium]|nr:hypothetical protein [candidate division Zixibacteria bacterium]